MTRNVGDGVTSVLTELDSRNVEVDCGTHSLVFSSDSRYHGAAGLKSV